MWINNDKNRLKAEKWCELWGRPQFLVSTRNWCFMKKAGKCMQPTVMIHNSWKHNIRLFMTEKIHNESLCKSKIRIMSPRMRSYHVKDELTAINAEWINSSREKNPYNLFTCLDIVFKNVLQRISFFSRDMENALVKLKWKGSKIGFDT